jgi:hypothetical protein
MLINHKAEEKSRKTICNQLLTQKQACYLTVSVAKTRQEGYNTTEKSHS